MNKFNMSYFFKFFFTVRALFELLCQRAPDSKMMTICQSYSCLMACTIFVGGRKDFVIEDIIVWISLNLKVNTSRQFFSGVLSKQDVVCKDIRLPQILESFVWIRQELSVQGTVTLLMTLCGQSKMQLGAMLALNFVIVDY